MFTECSPSVTMFTECSPSVTMFGTSREHLGSILKKKTLQKVLDGKVVFVLKVYDLIIANIDLLANSSNLKVMFPEYSRNIPRMSVSKSFHGYSRNIFIAKYNIPKYTEIRVFLDRLSNRYFLRYSPDFSPLLNHIFLLPMSDFWCSGTDRKCPRKRLKSKRN